jgi:hypothetical protein
MTQGLDQQVCHGVMKVTPITNNQTENIFSTKQQQPMALAEKL